MVIRRLRFVKWSFHERIRRPLGMPARVELRSSAGLFVGRLETTDGRLRGSILSCYTPAMEPKRSDQSPSSPTDGPARQGVGRRAVLQTLVGGVGAGFALPGVAGAGQHAHPAFGDRAVVAAAQEGAAAGAEAAFLDPHQLKTLEVLAEAIVPGSTEAKVAPFLDQLVAVGSADDRRGFLSALGAFDMFAIEKHRKPWVALSADEQVALLEAASTADPGRRPGGGGTLTIRDHFNSLRGAISEAYFSSEKGMRELGWTGNVFHQELPGCTHPGGHTG